LRRRGIGRASTRATRADEPELMEALLICDTGAPSANRKAAGPNNLMDWSTGNVYVPDSVTGFYKTSPVATWQYVLMPTLQLMYGNVVNFRDRYFEYPKFLVNMNATGQDVAVFTGLPARYRIERLFICDASSNLSTVAKIGLYSGPNASGTAVVTSALVSCPQGGVNDLTIVSAIKNAVQSFSTLYLNNTLALGLAASATFILSVTDVGN